jgi:homoserine O-acetyltransferase
MVTIGANMAEMHGYGWLIGPGKALDPNKLFLIMSELFGNGRSSSPSNTPEPFAGPRFPVMTIRDNVRAVHELLTKELHVQHLRAAGASPEDGKFINEHVAEFMK